MAGHVPGGDSPVLARGRLDGVHLLRAGGEGGTLRHVSGCIDAVHVRAQAIVDQHSVADRDPAAFEEVDVGGDTGSAHHEVGGD